MTLVYLCLAICLTSVFISLFLPIKEDGVTLRFLNYFLGHPRKDRKLIEKLRMMERMEMKREMDAFYRDFGPLGEISPGATYEMVPSSVIVDTPKEAEETEAAQSPPVKRNRYIVSEESDEETTT